MTPVGCCSNLSKIEGEEIMSNSVKLVRGVGINDADYAVRRREIVHGVTGKQKQITIWRCPFYEVWSNMLARCYYGKSQEKNPSYSGCSVCDEWLTFSNFKSWMEQQDWEGKELDKDILLPNNKIYSEETCVFISARVNAFMTERRVSRGQYPTGVSLKRENQKFAATCSNPFSKKKEHLGYFTCQDTAHKVWLARKLELAKLLAAEQDDPRVAKALVERYENYVLEVV